MKVKICGITRAEDALMAESLGAWAVGYIFHPSSPRYITPDKAGDISSELGADIQRIGVFVDNTFQFVKETFEKARLTAVQFHGSETPDFLDDFKEMTVIKALRVGNDFDLNVLTEYKAFTVLLDSHVDGIYGGTGKTLDRKTAADCVKSFKQGKIILAGGIKPGNVSEAIKKVNPWGIDVSSGVEITPGIKDKNKMTELFNNIRE